MIVVIGLAVLATASLIAAVSYTVTNADMDGY